jgi:UDP-N-acetyl-D-mannosaminuronic acid dehydrogenase
MKDYLNVGDNKLKRILVVGGGFVGLTLSAKLLKSKDCFVTVLENNVEKVDGFLVKNYGIFEPGLDNILNTNFAENRLTFVHKLDEAKFDLVFICINTNKDELNRIDKQLELVNSLVNNLSEFAHIYLRSTVPVGSTTKISKMLKASSRNDLKVFFAPERTAEGIALKELDSLPQIIGCPEYEDTKIGVGMLNSLGFTVTETSNSESAEFIKLMCNIWRDSTFAISNEFAIFAESLNLDIFEIIEKANFKYPRSVIPKPGPVGGPCLSKDTYIFLESIEKNLTENSIILKSRKQNEKITKVAFDAISIYQSKNPSLNRVCFLGAAFKGNPRTNDFRNSFTQELIRMLVNDNLEIKVWDPTLIPADLLEYSDFHYKDLNSKECDIVVIGNNASFMFESEVIDFLKNLPSSALIIDMWGVLRQLPTVKASLYRFGIKV